MKKGFQYSTKILAIALLYITSLLVFIYIADENVLENEMTFDTRVSAFVVAHATPLLTRTMINITFFGSIQFLLPAYIAMLAYLLLNKKTADVAIAIIGISSTVLMFLLKQLFKRHRPLLPVFENAYGYSFPSGHSFTSFIFCSILAYLLWMSSIKTIWKFTAIIALLLSSITIGISRIILNMHYATDVIAAFCLGILYMLSAYWLIQKLHPKIKPG